MQYSVVEYKTVQKGNEGFRYDAEYFQPSYLTLDNLLNNVKSNYLSEITRKIDVGHVGSMVSEYSENGVLLLQTQNVREFFLDLNDCKRINTSFHLRLKKSEVKYGDILIARSGSFGSASIYLEKEVINSADIIIVESELDKVNPFYLVTFLNSDIGKNQMYRFASGGLQGHVNLTILEKLKVPILGTGLQGLVERMVKSAYELRKLGKELYSQAEQILLSELGLGDWKPKHQLSFINKFSDTQSADRIDADYFQPAYAEMLEVVKSTRNYARLGDLVSIKKCVEPGSEVYQDSGIPFVRVSNLSKFGINDDNQQFVSESLYESLKIHQPKQDEILLSKDATPGIAYYLSDVPGKMIPSGGILRLTVTDKAKIIPEYLTLVLNSVIVQKQIERDVGGSVINHWLVDQVKNAVIPVLEALIQQRISEKLAESFSNCEKSKRLLEIAKSGVEMAIEKSEEEAQNWINQEVAKQ